MGNICMKGFYKKDVSILFIGLEGAGKTAILYQLKFGELLMPTVPTIGFNMETLKYGSINITAWDVGGKTTIRSQYNHYYNHMDVLILVVDSSNRARISESKDETWKLLSEEELKSAVLLVMANKQDLPNAMSVKEVTEKLELNKITGRKWHIQGTCATTGDGVYEGMDWLHQTLTHKRAKKARPLVDDTTPLKKNKPAS